ncbi:type I polyketide synthase [Cryptosporangium aurantiacum]|uniref:Phthiocerol/phenolphthiocerol synthesis type-I polyketide synthase D n=1 Tax=Cryptosporangium aurantiacum TaxID=134849 RepID=A0A1M7QFX9_9ACTN|nr:type I polyketide synthase [Cryptosporangium aurantiacum]SHN29555.1 phthiocerol/phenolphthiocerol synthesis type-I polyketide synthase D [Cryptosporangium aurantiacum]
MNERELTEWLVARIAAATGADPADIDPHHPLGEIGLSSRDSVAIIGELERVLGRSLAPTLVWEFPTVQRLAAGLASVSNSASPSTGSPVRGATGEPVTGRRSEGEPIAIVGLGCRFPGDVRTPAEFWELLAEGRNGVRKVPEDRWEQFSDGSAGDQAVIDGTTRWGGYLGDVTGFDAEFFGITPREAELMDPQQRLLLEVAWEALEHAGLVPESLRGTATGVFVGASGTEYGHLTGASLQAIDAWTATGSALSIVSNRLSYLLDLRGPSVTLDTACSSSLVAVHQACQSLRAGESDTALAGGVNLLLSPSVTVTFDQAGALAPDGRCKTFDADADGIARGEGCGVVVLKRLSDARRDGDRVLAVIRGSGVNQDGRSNGLTAPNPVAQTDLLRRVYAATGLSPTEIDYVEAHGTGTLLGDPIEAQALGAALGAGREIDRPLLIGSVKTNLGHLEAAAGVAGLIKVVLAMVNHRIPASLHYTAPNPHIPFEDARLAVADRSLPWPRYAGVARAGVSAFGFGGTNAHVVLEEHPTAPPPRSRRRETEPVVSLPLSAPTPERLRTAAGALADWLESPAGRQARPAEVAATLAHHRGQGRTRAVVVHREGEGGSASTVTDAAVESLRRLAAGEEWPGVVTGPARPAPPAKGPVWVFSGYGSHWAGMGQRLYREEPVFADAVDALDPHLVAIAGFSLAALVESGEKPRDLAVIQIATFGIQLALTAVWRAHGVEPAAVIGHSMGEITAAVVAGALSPEDGVRVITLRSNLMVEAARRILSGGGDLGGTAVVDLTADEVDALASRWPGVGVAVYASPTQCTVAGDSAQLAELVAHVESLGRAARMVNVKGAAHSPIIDVILDDFRAGLTGLTPHEPSIPLYGTVLPDPRTVPAFDPEYWAANVRRSVRFTQAVAAAAADGHTVFVEVSPHPIATVPTGQTLEAAGVAAPVLAWTLRRDTDDLVTFASNVATLHAHGVPVDLRIAPGRLVDLPTTPWRHRPHWVAARPRHTVPAGVHPLLGVHVEMPGQHAFRGNVGTEAVSWLADHRVHGVVVLPGAAFAELALAAAVIAFGVPAGRVALTDLELQQILPLSASTELTTTLTGAGAVEVWGRSAAGDWIRYATATVSITDEPLPDPEPSSPGGEAVDLYTRVPLAGQSYGPAFRGVVHATLPPASAASGPAASGPAAGDGVGRATARVTLPEAAGSAAGYHAHPAQLDALLQTLAVAALAYDVPTDSIYLPAGIGALRLAGPLPAEVHADVTLVPSGDNGALGTVRVRDAEGALVAELRDVYLRRADRGSVPVPLAEKLFEAAWEPAERLEAAHDGRWLVLGSGDRADRVGVLLGDAGQQVIPGTDLAPDVTDVLVLPDHGSPEQAVLAVARAAQLLSDTASPPRLWTGTTGAAAVADGEVVEPAVGAVRALIRVLGVEHPELTATLVDADSAEALVSELLAHAPDTEIARRGDRRWVARLTRVELPDATGGPLVRPGGYVISGGLGGLGLLLTSWLAERGAGRIVLNSRRGTATPEVADALDRLRAGGTEIEVVTGDIAEPGVAEELVAAATSGDLPLHGVVHAAGTLADQAVLNLDAETLQRVWSPKVTGALRLHEAVGDTGLDWFLVYSSAAGLLGSPGQASYATANAWLDAFVEWRRAQGLPATSIQWGAWAQVGGARDTTNALLEPITPEEGMEALAAVLGSGRAVTGVTRLNAAQVLALFPRVGQIPFFAHVMAELSVPDEPTADWIGVEALRALEPTQAWDGLIDRLLARVGGIMGYRAGDLDFETPLTELGLDSLMAMRAKNAVEADFGVQLPVRLLLQGASLDDFVRHIGSEIGLPEREASATPKRKVLAGRDHTERLLRGLIEEVLDRTDVSVDEEFAGDRAAAERVRELVLTRAPDLPYDVDTLFANPTIAAMADLVRPYYEGSPSPLRVLRAEGSRRPLFLAHPAGGPSSVYQELVSLLHPDQPAYGLERIDELITIEAKAARYIELIREVQPHGPYQLGGWSLGGCVAYEMAQQLRADGEEVAFVAVIDTIVPLPPEPGKSEQELITDRLMGFLNYLHDIYGIQVEIPYDELFQLDDIAQTDLLMKLMADAGLGMSKGILQHQRDSYLDMRVAERYRIQPYDGRVILYRATEAADLIAAQDPRYLRTDEALGFDEWCSNLEVVPLPGDHLSLIDRPNLDVLASHLDGVLAEEGAR